MARIAMPPPISVRGRTHVRRLPFREELFLDFSETGYFGPVQDGIFHDGPGHDFPSGLITPQSIGPFYAVADNTEVDLVFFDQDTNLAYLVRVEVR